MPFKASARIEGLGALLTRLDALKRGKRTAVLRKATAKAAKLVLTAAKNNLRAYGFKRKDSLLVQSLGSKVVVKKSTGSVTAVVGPRTGFKRPASGPAVVTKLGRKFQAAGANPARYAHLVEKGRRGLVPTKKKIMAYVDGYALVWARSARPVAARPFLIPALERNRDKVRDVMAAEIGAGLLKLAKAG